MGRYIDADKLLEYLEKAGETDEVKYSFIGAGVQATISVIKKFPLEDAKPVVHAHKDIATSKSGMTMFLECSNCQGAIDYSDAYCKYCGAKMDEVQDG